MELSNKHYELLNLSRSDSSEEFQELVRKRRYKRKVLGARYYQNRKSAQPAGYCQFFKFCEPLLYLLYLGLTVCVFILIWKFMQLKIQMQLLRNLTESVSAGYNGLPESIQKCHSLTRHLEENQTKIFDQLQKVDQRLTNFSNLINGIQSDLFKVEKKLDESPPQLNVPNILQTLTTNVASFKDQIDEIQSKATRITEEQSEIKKIFEVLNSNVSSLNVDLLNLKKNAADTSSLSESTQQEMVNLIAEKIKPNITSINSTLGSQVRWMSDDINKALVTINNLTDESEYLKSLISTVRNDLQQQNNAMNTLKNDIKDRTNQWDKLLDESKIFQLNYSKVLNNYAQCKYICNEETSTGIPSISTSSELSNSTTNNTSF